MLHGKYICVLWVSAKHLHGYLMASLIYHQRYSKNMVRVMLEDLQVPKFYYLDAHKHDIQEIYKPH